MSKYESISLFINGFGVLTLWVGFIFVFVQIKSAIRQISVMIETHRQNHELQRKMAAQLAVNEYNFSSISAELHNIFGYINNNLPISMDVINQKFSESDDNRVKLIMLLRHYESLARGINHGVYDEGVVKATLHRTIIRFARAFSVYIEERRTVLSSPTQWLQFTTLAEKWANEDKKIHVSHPTGDLQNL